MKGKIYFLNLLFISFGFGVITSCSTDDVEGETPIIETELVEIPDAAFGEYMLFEEIPGIYEEIEEGQTHYYLDPTEVAVVSELSLSKTSSNVETLVGAGLATAETKIADVTGIEYFVGLQSLSLTSNNVSQIDLTNLTGLQELGLNFNLIGSLDLSTNTALTNLRYKGSSSAEENQKLSTIDLSANTLLKELYLPNHNFVTIDLSNNLQIDELLDMSGNPGPDGDPDTPDIVVPAAIYDQLAPDNRLGVVSDAEVDPLVTLAATSITIAEDGTVTTVTVNLNTMLENPVTVNLTLEGTATLDADYTITGETLTIPAGETQATVEIASLPDSNIEGNETIILNLGEITNAEAADNQEITITIEDDDLTIPLILNEILYDPSNNDLDGDANGDGVYAQNEDEFVELYNHSGAPLDVSGFKLFDADGLAADTPNHIIPEGTVIPANSALVVFGGGIPTGNFGGALVQTSTSGDLNFNNADDVLTVQDTEGAVIITFNIEPFSNNPNESYTRNPDITGEEFVQHGDVSETLFSPGTKIDGSDF